MLASSPIWAEISWTPAEASSVAAAACSELAAATETARAARSLAAAMLAASPARSPGGARDIVDDALEAAGALLHAAGGVADGVDPGGHVAGALDDAIEGGAGLGREVRAGVDIAHRGVHGGDGFRLGQMTQSNSSPVCEGKNGHVLHQSNARQSGATRPSPGRPIR